MAVGGIRSTPFAGYLRWRGRGTRIANYGLVGADGMAYCGAGAGRPGLAGATARASPGRGGPPGDGAAGRRRRLFPFEPTWLPGRGKALVFRERSGRSRSRRMAWFNFVLCRSEDAHGARQHRC